MDDFAPEDQGDEGSPLNLDGAAETSARPGTPQRARRIWMLLLPLLGGLMCMGITAALLVRPARRPALSVPVTGDATATPRPRRAAASASPANADEYRSAVKDYLSNCEAAFHDFMLMEEMVVHQPDLLGNTTWRADISTAIQSFRSDCSSLSGLPTAPPAYGEVDHWLELAAGEVTPAADSFSSLLDSQNRPDMHAAVDHLLRFAEYAHNAEAVLNNMSERREI